MPDRGPSLSDVLVQVPVLLPLLLTECSANFGARDEMMRDLRLVSKDTSITVMREVTQCSVQLGEGAFPNPAQVIRLMQYSKLQSLHITINTTSGGVMAHAPAYPSGRCTWVFPECLFHAVGLDCFEMRDDMQSLSMSPDVQCTTCTSSTKVLGM